MKKFIVILLWCLISITQFDYASDIQLPETVMTQASKSGVHRKLALDYLRTKKSEDGWSAFGNFPSSNAGPHIIYNTTEVYLYADEICYPFTYFNWPSVMSKDQLVALVRMENSIAHADWKCLKIVDRYNSDGELTSHTETPSSGKCGSSAFKPNFNGISFGRTFVGSIYNIGQIGNSSSTYMQASKKWSWEGGLGYYPVGWTPTFAFYGQGPDPGQPYTVRHRIYLSVDTPAAMRTAMTEVKKYGTNNAPDTSGIETDTEGPTPQTDPDLDSTDEPQEEPSIEDAAGWWNDKLNSISSMNSEEFLIFSSAYTNVTGYQLTRGSTAYRYWDSLKDSQKNKAYKYYLRLEIGEDGDNEDDDGD